MSLENGLTKAWRRGPGCHGLVDPALLSNTNPRTCPADARFVRQQGLMRAAMSFQQH
jgi:hypothetical protein